MRINFVHFGYSKLEHEKNCEIFPTGGGVKKNSQSFPKGAQNYYSVNIFHGYCVNIFHGYCVNIFHGYSINTRCPKKRT